MENLFMKMFEGDPPAVDTPEVAPPAEEPVADAQMDDGGDMNAPPDMGDMAEPSMGDDGGFGPEGGEESGAEGEGGEESGAEGEGGEGQEQEDDTTLDEKGEIFAKVKILKEFKALYNKIDDTISLFDKIDIVQIGNNIRSGDVSEIKDGFSDLMMQVYSTIVYDFQQQYKTLKVKLVEYSSQYILLTKKLVTLIKKDQKTT